MSNTGLEISETIIARGTIAKTDIGKGLGARNVDHTGAGKGEEDTVDGDVGGVVGEGLELGRTVLGVKEKVTGDDRGCSLDLRGGASQGDSRGNGDQSGSKTHFCKERKEERKKREEEVRGEEKVGGRKRGVFVVERIGWCRGE